MKILVCIKQVPDMESKFRVNADETWFDMEDLAWRMNEYDEFAVEQAVRVKKQVGEADITVLSIGPARVTDMLKKALAVGCDRAVHMVDEQVDMREPFVIASLIAQFARDKGFDLVFTGMQSQDRGSGQVGVLLAELLSISCVTTVVDFVYRDNRIVVKRELEGGVRAEVVTAIPALVTCQLGLNTPRYPTFPNIMKAKKKELKTIPVDDPLAGKPMQETTKLYFPEKGTGIVLEGESGEIAEQLIGILKTETGLIRGAG